KVSVSAMPQLVFPLAPPGAGHSKRAEGNPLVSITGIQIVIQRNDFVRAAEGHADSSGSRTKAAGIHGRRGRTGFQFTVKAIDLRTAETDARRVELGEHFVIRCKRTADLYSETVLAARNKAGVVPDVQLHFPIGI